MGHAAARPGRPSRAARGAPSADTQRTRVGVSIQTRTGNTGALHFDVAGERADSPWGVENGVLVRMQGRF